MKIGDLILYTPNKDSKERPDIGVILKLSPSGRKASVLWSGESVGIFFAVGDLHNYPDNFKLVSK